MRKRAWSILLLTGALAYTPAPAEAQLKEAAIGGGMGFLGGAVSTLSIVVARARFQGRYLDSPQDLIHWQTTPLIVGPAAGVAFGLMGPDVLKGSIIGSTSGLLIGAAAGATLGWILSAEQEAPWAGGVIGAGVGLNMGGAIGAFLAAGDEDDGTEPAPIELSLRVRL